MSRRHEPGAVQWLEARYRRAEPFLPSAGLVLAVYGAVRAVALVADLLAAHLYFGGDLSGPLRSWDASWYLRLAQSFYPAHAPMAYGRLLYGAGGFEPLFPALIRTGMLLGLSPVQSAFVVSLLGGAALTLLVWRLGAALVDEEVGRIAAVLVAVFPGMGVAWGLLYCESVGLALVAGSLLLMVRGRWISAGVVGALATATNPMALALVAPALFEALAALRRRRDPAPLAGTLLVPVGFVAYVGFLGLRYHDLLYWWHLQRQAWGAKVDFGWSLLSLLAHPLAGGFQGKGWMQWIGVVAVALACGALYRSRLRSPVLPYCAAVFLMSFVSNEQGFKPRALAWAFPALIAVAVVTRRRYWQPVALLFAGLLPMVVLLYTLYGNYVVQP